MATLDGRTHKDFSSLRLRLGQAVFLALLYSTTNQGVDARLGIPALQRRDGTAKAGLAWNNPNLSMNALGSSSNVGWYYTWSPWPVTAAPSNLEFVPMFWGIQQITDFQAQVNPGTILERNYKNILAMNEPNQQGQAYISAGDGAAQWKQYLEPLKADTGVRLGSPAPTNAPDGKQWLYDFLGACGGNCTVDFIALHYYGINATDFINHVTDYHNAFQRPIWVTEWACQNFGDPKLGQCSDKEVSDFLETTQSWMEKTDFVERYSWLGATINVQGVNPDNNLMNSNGQLNDLGNQYLHKGGGSTTSGASPGPTTTGPGGVTGTGGVIPLNAACRLLVGKSAICAVFGPVLLSVLVTLAVI
ncbi:hypothetical protein FRC04_001057 [Tulasnella sp. 424]|nr:hypothetical protein FRC04_001057 [Tulasnella sp. 424]KAG8969848.1 hypothetical protein FRC05_000825 [Tulasnella sp. 425]